MKRPVGRQWQYLKWIAAGGLLVLLLSQVDFESLGTALANLTIPSFAFLMYLSIVMIILSAVKWSVFLSALVTSQADRPKLGSLINLYLVGYFVNLLMPSYLGGDLVRSWYVGKKTGQHEALSATVLERYTGLVAMVLLGVVMMWFTDLATREIKIAVLLVALGLGVASILAVSERTLQLVERWILAPIKLGFVGKHLRKIQSALILGGKNPRVLAEALALSILYHTLTVANTAATGYAVGWTDPPLMVLFVVLPLILLLGAIPLTPSGLGVQEGAFYVFLVQVGATPAQALGIGVVLRAKTYVLALVGGVVWFFGYRKNDSFSLSGKVEAIPAE